LNPSIYPTLRAEGGHQGSQPINTTIGYSSEQKMLREQVLAALRKLEGGEITVIEFEDMIYQMGIELPEVLVKHLRQNQMSGQLDWTLCVRNLDAHVFKSKLLTDQPDLNDIKNIKSRLLFALQTLVSIFIFCYYYLMLLFILFCCMELYC
jgi:hypothetical protein